MFACCVFVCRVRVYVVLHWDGWDIKELHGVTAIRGRGVSRGGGAGSWVGISV